MVQLPSRLIGITLSAVALLLTLGSYLGQRKPTASSELEQGFSALEEIPAQRPERSIQAFRSALARDPASPFRWCDLGEAYLMAGDVEKARTCYLRGSALAPRMPPVQLRLCNFHIRAGDLSNAAVCLAELLKTAPAYREMVLSYYDRLGLSPEQFASRLDPDGVAALLGHLLHEKNFDDAARLWEEKPRANPTGNGDFEEPIGESVHNWTVQGPGVERECEDSFSGKCSLKIQSSSGSVSQTVFVRPGVYKLELFARSDDAKAGALRVTLTDLEDAARFVFRSGALETGSTWTAIGCTFSVPARTRFVTLRLEGAAVQLDHVSITPAGSKAP